MCSEWAHYNGVLLYDRVRISDTRRISYHLKGINIVWVSFLAVITQTTTHIVPPYGDNCAYQEARTDNILALIHTKRKSDTNLSLLLKVSSYNIYAQQLFLTRSRICLLTVSSPLWLLSFMLGTASCFTPITFVIITLPMS